MPDDFANMGADQARAFAQGALATPAEYADDALALRFSGRHAGQLLHVAAWNRWLRWDGCRWKPDDTLSVFDLVRAVCREASKAAVEAGGETARIARQVASGATAAAVERLARADRRHARAAAEFDADPWALNTPGGVVDLRTGVRRAHRPADLFTKVTGAAPGGGCPRWLRFLHEITNGDPEVVAYLKRWVGYCLTGDVSEHTFVYAKRPGGNGKSVLLNTAAAALGDYAVAADMSLFVASRGDQHPTGLADLRGAQLVVAQEIEAGARLAEAKVKSLTGGDRIKARRMRADFEEFQPQFKLVMAGNHAPELRNPDPAMRRRLQMLPLTFVPEEPDKNLPEALRAELGGILTWAIEGCTEWRRLGLLPPEPVRRATADFFEAQDSIAAWVAERCEKREGAAMQSGSAFRDWSAWAKAQGVEPGTGKSFSAEMERDFAKARTKTGAVFKGIRLKHSETGVFHG